MKKTARIQERARHSSTEKKKSEMTIYQKVALGLVIAVLCFLLVECGIAGNKKYQKKYFTDPYHCKAVVTDIWFRSKSRHKQSRWYYFDVIYECQGEKYDSNDLNVSSTFRKGKKVGDTIKILVSRVDPTKVKFDDPDMISFELEWPWE